jgi:hypothetical protein
MASDFVTRSVEQRCHRIPVERESETSINSIWRSDPAMYMIGSLRFPKEAKILEPTACSLSANRNRRCEHSPCQSSDSSIIADNISLNYSISFGSAEKIVHEEYLLKKSCAQWPPKYQFSTRRRNMFLRPPIACTS